VSTSVPSLSPLSKVHLPDGSVGETTDCKILVFRIPTVGKINVICIF